MVKTKAQLDALATARTIRHSNAQSRWQNREQQALNTYGLKPVANMTQIDYDQVAFARRLSRSTGCPSRWELFKRIAATALPGHFEWHDWTERAVRPLIPDVSRDQQSKIKVLCGFPGCSSSGKTFNITSFACLWWLCWPEESSVTLVSTTMKMLKRRGWAEVEKVYYDLEGNRFGNLVPSRIVWQARRGDDRHAVIGQAVEEGNVQKVADNLKGVHTRRQMIIVDEATSIPRAIFEACGNLCSYPDEFILAVIGNPWNRLDQFGLFCEPEKGWNSVTVDTGEWEAKPFELCEGMRPWITTFDAEKSPNIKEGKVVSRHLPKLEEVDAARRASNGGNTPTYWQNKRGFWPPEGLIKTVFTESALVKFDAIDGQHQFTDKGYSIVGACDPAFGGGDRPVLRFGKLGVLANGSYALQALKPITLHIDANDPKTPVTYQLLKLIKEHCERVEISPGVYTACAPQNLGVDDGSGEGGLCDVLYREWSHAIQRIQFQGAASTEPASLEDPKPSNEVYYNKRVEMYFYSNTAMLSGQLKGIDRETAKELCSIEFDGSKKKVTLQSKAEYRATHADESPDYADSLVMLLEVSRRHGFVLSALGMTAKIVDEINEEVQRAQELHYEENTYQEEELEGVESFL